MQGIQGTKEEGEGERRGGAKRRRKKNFETPWQIYGKIKEGGISVGRLACIRTENIRDSKSRLVVFMLGRIQETMLGKRHGTPRWADEPMGWI